MASPAVMPYMMGGDSFEDTFVCCPSLVPPYSTIHNSTVGGHRGVQGTLDKIESISWEVAGSIAAPHSGWAIRTD